MGRILGFILLGIIVVVVLAIEPNIIIGALVLLVIGYISGQLFK